MSKRIRVGHSWAQLINKARSAPKTVNSVVKCNSEASQSSIHPQVVDNCAYGVPVEEVSCSKLDEGENQLQKPLEIAVPLLEDNTNAHVNFAEQLLIDMSSRPTVAFEIRELLFNHKRVPIQFVDKLLKILRKHNVDVPASYNKLMGTSLKKPDLLDVPPGDYLYFSLEDITKELIGHNITGLVEFDIHIDGSSPADSSALTLWTVMIGIVGRIDIKPIILGIYSGFKQPADIDMLTAPLCEELGLERAFTYEVRKNLFSLLSTWCSSQGISQFLF